MSTGVSDKYKDDPDERAAVASERATVSEFLM